MKYLCDHMYCDLTPEECPCWCHREEPVGGKPRVYWWEECQRWFPYVMLLLFQTAAWMALPTEPGMGWIRIAANTLTLGGTLAYCQLRKLPSEQAREELDKLRHPDRHRSR